MKWFSRWAFAMSVCLLLAAWTSSAAFGSTVSEGASGSLVAGNNKKAEPVANAKMSRAEAESSIGANALAYYEKQFGVAEAVARFRLGSQLMGQGAEAVLNERYGDAITGLSFDNSSGTWNVSATSTVSSTAIESVFAADGLASNFQIKRVPYTRSALASAAEKLSARLQSLVGNSTARVGYGGGAITVDVASQASQSARQSIESATNEVTSSAASPAIQITSVPQSSLVARPTSLSCTFPYCNSVVAGAFYFTSKAGCTEAWYGWSKTSGGTTYEKILTAGHCVNAMGGNYVNNYTDVPGKGEAKIGYGVRHALGEGGDWGTVVMSLPLASPLEAAPFPGYYNWAGGYGTYLQYWYNNGWPAEGSIVCHQGYGSGEYSTGATQCGVVGPSESLTETIEGVETTLKPMLRINKTDACEGDSGGPWFLESEKPTAVGVQSSATVGTINAHCGSTAWMTTTSQINKMYAAEGDTFGLYG